MCGRTGLSSCAARWWRCRKEGLAGAKASWPPGPREERRGSQVSLKAKQRGWDSAVRLPGFIGKRMTWVLEVVVITLSLDFGPCPAHACPQQQDT